MSDYAAAAQGQRARAELAQTEEAFAKVRAAMLEEIVRTGPDQTAKRERLIVGCQIIDAVKAALTSVIVNGQYAEQALAQADLLRR